jgi:hypothetical protein
MTFNPTIWRPIAIGLSALNLVAVGFAAGEPLHAGIHAALALGFGLWAQRLGGGASRPSAGSELEARLESLDAEVRRLQDVESRLIELEERLDFTERALVDARTRAQIKPEA